MAQRPSCMLDTWLSDSTHSKWLRGPTLDLIVVITWLCLVVQLLLCAVAWVIGRNWNALTWWMVWPCMTCRVLWYTRTYMSWLGRLTIVHNRVADIVWTSVFIPIVWRLCLSSCVSWLGIVHNSPWYCVLYPQCLYPLWDVCPVWADFAQSTVVPDTVGRPCLFPIMCATRLVLPSWCNPALWHASFHLWWFCNIIG